MLSKATF